MKKVVKIASGQIQEPEGSAIATHFKTLKDGEYLFSLTQPRQIRSGNQNRTFYMWIGLIETETGQNQEDIKRYLMRSLGFGTWTSIKIKRKGEIVKQDTFTRWSTAEIDKYQFKALMDKTHELAAWNDIILPLPEERL
jgi:hypothetical protein